MFFRISVNQKLASQFDTDHKYRPKHETMPIFILSDTLSQQNIAKTSGMIRLTLIHRHKVK